MTTEFNKNMDMPNGVMLNAYPDSIGKNLADIINLLKKREFEDVFSLFYILPTIFNSDLDRGFSIIDYDLNDELVSKGDFEELNKLNIEFMFDLVLNHLSVGSPQFQDMLKHGDESKYKNFFIDWNEFWQEYGEMGPEGCIIPHNEYLDKLFMRKPGLPILKVRFPDGTEKPYWNTFYQEITYPQIKAEDLMKTLGSERISIEDAEKIASQVNSHLLDKQEINELDFDIYDHLKNEIIAFVEQNRQYSGQMDLNAQSPLVWEFYEETFKKLSAHGGKFIRLDAFAYLHKEPGMINFFNKPGTWNYLAKLKQLADKNKLILLPEIHSIYGSGLHEEVASKGYPVYDFFFPGLVIHSIEWGTNRYLLNWIRELLDKNIKTINMLGCHDGIPIIDLQGGEDSVSGTKSLMSDEEMDAIVNRILKRGGRVENLYGPDGKKISYYQVNATFYSALGEDEQKLLLARAIQIFTPGIPQVWYLDLFAGKNDYAAANKGGTGGYREINRTTLTISDVKNGLNRSVVQKQLELLRLRNTSPAFNGKLIIGDTDENKLQLTWKNNEYSATLVAELSDYSFQINHRGGSDGEKVYTL